MAEGHQPPGAEGGGRPRGPILVALGLVALGVLLVTQALAIRQGAGFSVIRPGAMPLAVSIGITLPGVAYLVRSTLLVDAETARRVVDEERATYWPTVGLLGALLVAYALALNGFRLGPVGVPGLGYVVATGLFLPTAARIMGSRHLARDAAIGLVVAVVVFVGFTQFLGVRLPAGVLDPIL